MNNNNVNILEDVDVSCMLSWLKKTDNLVLENVKKHLEMIFY